jgi:hypothetical protein
MKITDLFKEEELKQKNDGNFQTECPDCGLQGGRTQGFILFTETDTSFCHSSHKHFNLLETYALKNKIIKCLDGRDTGDKEPILKGDLFKQTLDMFREEYGIDKYNEVLEQLNIKQSIQLPNDGVLISTFARQLSRRIKTENILFYRPDTSEIVEIGKIKNPDGTIEYTGFVPVSANRFITIIERYFRPWQVIYTKFDKINVNRSLSTTVANVVMASDDFRDEMPVINRIFTTAMPIMYEGKLTFPNKGYDPRFGSWLPFNAPTISNPNMNVEEAKKIIQYIYQEFCYHTKQDYTHAIAGLLTPFLRGLYARFTCRTPLFVITANRERAGKDYHEGVRSILYEGMALEEPPISDSDNVHNNHNDELRKKIISNMLYGRKKIHFSNNKGIINNAVFESILTAEHYSDRKLGTNLTVSLPHEIEYSLSGNVGMGMTADLANRARKITLFLEVEDANSREFVNPDLHGWVLNNRSLILSALYALVRNWVEKGMPSGSKPFTSFPEWARVCGGIMECAGYDSPCDKDLESLGVATDSETSDMKALFELCYEHYPETKVDKQQVKELLKDNKDGLFGYINWEDKKDQTKFGIKFNKYVGRVMSDIKLSVVNNNVRSSRWEYVFTKQKQNFDKKAIFGEDFTENIPEIGNLGNLGNVSHHSKHLYSSSCSNTQKVTNVTKVTKTSKQKKVKQTDDRQIQFWEAEECKNIIPTYTKEQVLELIKTNRITPKEVYEKLGDGSFKYVDELINEGLIAKDGEMLYGK